MDESYQIDTTTTWKSLYADLNTYYNTVTSDSYVVASGSRIGMLRTSWASAGYMRRLSSSGVLRKDINDREDFSLTFIMTLAINFDTTPTNNQYVQTGYAIQSDSVPVFVSVEFRRTTSGSTQIKLQIRWLSTTAEGTYVLFKDWTTIALSNDGAPYGSNHLVEIHLNMRMMTLSGTVMFHPSLYIIDKYNSNNKINVSMTTTYYVTSGYHQAHLATYLSRPFLTMYGYAGTYSFFGGFIEKVTML